MKFFKTIFMLLLIVCSANQVFSATLLIDDDFEEGSGWDYNDEWNNRNYFGDQWDIVTTTPRSGTYCARSTDANITTDYDSNFSNTWPNAGWGSQIFIRYWAKVPTDFAEQATDSCNGTIPTGGADHMRLGHPTRTWVGEWWSPISTFHMYDNSDPTVSTGLSWTKDNQWHEHAFLLKMPSSATAEDGIFKTWKDSGGDYSDGNAEVVYTNIDYDNYPTYFIIGMEYKGPVTSCGGVSYSSIFYMDDIQVWDDIPTGQNLAPPSEPQPSLSTPQGFQAIPPPQ